ncbi:histone deacetylase RPD3 [Favolaschia claudopus]|uniref:histone deacetylase n=1 Tax=Favolaschia claudopus TaxID=2862362 RepID=A0AAW0CHK3_9AGAR
MSKRRVAYYYDADVGAYTYGLGHPMKPHRVRVTHDLVSAYGMLPKMHVLRAKRASPESMTAFHTDEYINFLARVTPETAEELTHGGMLFLVGELPDNPAFEGVFEFCSISAGGSIAAAQRINSGATDIAINWAGGLHHAKKGEASGFCYINDIVLCILELLRTHPRVLYIDIDIHHGDGVEEAFYTTDRVMCASFHKFGEFFPGTGTQDDRGRGKGKGYSVNVPLDDGITDEAYKSVFEPVMTKILETFRPSAVVLQCGADSLSGDKLGGFNLSLSGHAACVQFMRATGLPLILLGGGGYTVKNVARAWTFETACALGIENEIDVNLPWNEYFDWFGPRYRLEVMPSNMEDLNVRDGSLDKVRELALEQLQQLRSKGAPSVGMHDVPRESLGAHLGFSSVRHREDEEARDDLDEKLAQHARYVYTLQQDADAGPSDDSENESELYSSDDNASAFRRRKRMSIMTNRYVDVPGRRSGGAAVVATTHPTTHTAHAKRRFFQSAARWDDRLERVVLGGARVGVAELGVVMESGGRGGRGRREEERDVDVDGEDWDMD